MKYLVLGGGVAGVCCAEELCRLCPTDEVTIVSAYRTLKVGSLETGSMQCARGCEWSFPCCSHQWHCYGSPCSPS